MNAKGENQEKRKTGREKNKKERIVKVSFFFFGSVIETGGI